MSKNICWYIFGEDNRFLLEGSLGDKYVEKRGINETGGDDGYDIFKGKEKVRGLDLMLA